MRVLLLRADTRHELARTAADKLYLYAGLLLKLFGKRSCPVIRITVVDNNDILIRLHALRLCAAGCKDNPCREQKRRTPYPHTLKDDHRATPPQRDVINFKSF